MLQQNLLNEIFQLVRNECQMSILFLKDFQMYLNRKLVLKFHVNAITS